MKREISKMQLCKSLAGLFCLFLTSGAPIEGMCLGNILDGKIQEQKKTLRALQVQIGEMNKNIEAEYQKNKNSRIPGKKKHDVGKKKHDVSNCDSELIEIQKCAIKNLEKKVPVLKKQVEEQKNLSDSIEKEIKSLDEKIEETQKLMKHSSLKEYDQKCPRKIFAFVSDTLADVAKTLGRTEMRYLGLGEAIENADDAEIMHFNLSGLMDEITKSEKQLNEKIAQYYNDRMLPINLMNENDREKAGRSASLLHENYELRRSLFMAENNMTKEEFNLL